MEVELMRQYIAKLGYSFSDEINFIFFFYNIKTIEVSAFLSILKKNFISEK